MKKEKSGNNIIKVVCFPDSWKIVKLKTISDITMGQSPKSKFYNNQKEGLPLIQGNNDCKNGFTAPTIWTSYITKTCNSNSLILSVRAPVGIVSKATTRVCIGRGVCSISPKNNTGFLYYYLKYLEKWWAKLSQGSTFKSISSKEIYNLIIPSPPLPEQKKIAEILSKWDRAIELTKKLIEKKELLKKELTGRILFGKIRNQKFVISNKKETHGFFSIPEDWNFPKIAEVATEICKKNSKNNNYTVLSCSKYKGFVNSLDYFGKKVFSDNLRNYKIIKRDEFGFPTNHIEEGSIGHLQHVESGIVSPIYIVFKTDNEKVHSPFLYSIFKSNIFLHIFKINTNASVDRRGSLRWKRFAKIHIPLPNMNEQIYISDVLKKIEKEIELLKYKTEKLKEQKKGLMQKLLTGKIRVKVKEE